LRDIKRREQSPLTTNVQSYQRARLGEGPNGVLVKTALEGRPNLRWQAQKTTLQEAAERGGKKGAMKTAGGSGIKGSAREGGSQERRPGRPPLSGEGGGGGSTCSWERPREARRAGGGPADQREPLARGARAPEGAHCYALGRSRLPLSCNTLAPWQRATGTARGLEITAPFPWRPGSDSRPRPARRAPPAPHRGRLPLRQSAPVTLATAAAAQTPTAAGPAPFPPPARPPAASGQPGPALWLGRTGARRGRRRRKPPLPLCPARKARAGGSPTQGRSLCSLLNSRRLPSLPGVLRPSSWDGRETLAWDPPGPACPDERDGGGGGGSAAQGWSARPKLESPSEFQIVSAGLHPLTKHWVGGPKSPLLPATLFPSLRF
jgi:hypothetical protein